MLLAAKYSGDPGLPFAASGPDVNFERLLFIKKVFGASGPQTGSLCCDSVLIHVVNLKDVLSTGYSEWFAVIAAVSMLWSPLALSADFFVPGCRGFITLLGVDCFLEPSAWTTPLLVGSPEVACMALTRASLF